MKKNKIIVFRFGSSIPVPNELRMLKQAEEKEGEIIACGAPTQFGLFSLFITKMTVREVAELFKKTADEEKDWLPVICIDADTKETCMSIKDEFENAYEMLKQQEATRICLNGEDTCNLTLDQLLDKVRDFGRDNLSKAELERLEKFSRGEE